VITPRLAREWALWKSGARRIAGVDEVGMACLAGPVVAAAVVMRPHCRKIAGVRDSKTVPLPQRERLYGLILQRAVAVGVGAASVEEIDRLNIYWARMLAMQRAVDALGFDPAMVLVDGNRCPKWQRPSLAIVDGDAKCRSIAAASIVAKVTRDRIMAEHALDYPGYGWERNKGYGTPEHHQGLERHGLTPLHRRSFAPVRAMLEDAGSPAATPQQLLDL
jgi:ribonuclease HII